MLSGFTIFWIVYNRDYQRITA